MKFKYKYIHPYLCPALVTLKGKKYLLPEWKEVNTNTTLEDIIWIKNKVNE